MNTKPKAEFFHIDAPGLSMTFIGERKPSQAPGMVLLCAPGGRPLLELPERFVTRSTPEEAAERFRSDAEIQAERRRISGSI